MKLPEYKAHPSSLGNLFIEPKLKKDKEEGNLSVTAKSMIELGIKEKIYGRKFEFGDNKYTTNGTVSEDNSISILANNSEFKKLKKNEKTFENDWLVGTPDLVLKDRVIDIKTSFSGKTFPLFDTCITNKLYYYQLQAYMFLTGKKKAELCYILGDIDEDIIGKEYRFNNPEELEYSDFRKTFIYENVDTKYRIKRFEIEYDKDFEEKVKAKVLKARAFIKERVKEIK